MGVGTKRLPEGRDRTPSPSPGAEHPWPLTTPQGQMPASEVRLLMSQDGPLTSQGLQPEGQQTIKSGPWAFSFLQQHLRTETNKQ